MDLRLARILCGTYIPSKRCFDKVAQIGPEKVSQSARLSSGHCPNAFVSNFVGASLSHIHVTPSHSDTDICVSKHISHAPLPSLKVSPIVKQVER